MATRHCLVPAPRRVRAAPGVPRAANHSVPAAANTFVATDVTVDSEAAVTTTTTAITANAGSSSRVWPRRAQQGPVDDPRERRDGGGRAAQARRVPCPAILLNLSTASA